MNSTQNFGGFLDQEEEDMLLATQLNGIRIVPYAIKSAIELDLFEIMAKDGPSGTHMSPLDLASKAAAKSPDAPMMIDRLLRLLVAYSVCTCKLVKDENGKEIRVYGIGKAGRKYIKDEDGFSMACTVVYPNRRIEDDNCSHITPSILEGGLKPFERANGSLLFDHLAKNATRTMQFNEMMMNQTSLIMKKLLKTYNGLEGLNDGVLVDVGGNVGGNLARILSEFPHLKGVNFDLPHIVAKAPKIPGVEHVGGDMFDAIPQGQAIFMKWILHDWSDEECVKILKNCYKALPKDGKVIIVEFIVPREIPENDLATKVVLHMDMVMMCQTTGGKERTKEEFEFLAKEAGFKPPKITYGAYAFWILELYKEE